MKCYQILFSPTGGTEKVAAAITQNLPGVQTIDLSSTSTDLDVYKRQQMGQLPAFYHKTKLGNRTVA